jgi:hypothetical protein
MKSDHLLHHVCQSVHPSVRLSAWTTQLSVDEFLWTLILNIFWQYVEKIQVSFKSDKNKGYFTLCPMQIYNTISLNSSKCVRQKLQRNQNTILCSINVVSKLFHLWDNVEKYSKVRQATHDNIIAQKKIWFLFEIAKATDTYTHISCLLFLQQ